MQIYDNFRKFWNSKKHLLYDLILFYFVFFAEVGEVVSGGLKSWSIALIVVFVIVLCMVILFVVYLYLSKKKGKAQSSYLME